MPANLPPDYHEAEERYRAARSPEDRIAALEEMLRVIPKHKGTEKLQGGIKSRIAKLKLQPKKKGARGQSHHIPTEGAGQVVLIGPPNSGKSALVGRLTHAHPEIADYPFATREALPGMMPYLDVAIQLIDLPPLSELHVEPWVYDLARTADMIWCVVEDSNSLDEFEVVRRMLGDKHIDLVPADAAPEGRPPSGWASKPALLVVTGADREGAQESMEILNELLDGSWPTVSVSAIDGQGLDELARRTFEALRVIRVYTKQPGKPADTHQPFTLPEGATVGDLAKSIHKDLLATLKFARIWGPSAFDGQTVHNDHVLLDGDVVEIHA
jgi:ribosome-interacting GTPase 1